LGLTCWLSGHQQAEWPQLYADLYAIGVATAVLDWLEFVLADEEEESIVVASFVEAMAQSAGILFSEGNADKKMLFMGIDACRFRKEVRPGDQLIMDIEVTQQRGAILRFKGVASVDGKKVAEAEMMAALDAGDR